MKFEISYDKETSNGEVRQVAREVLSFDAQEQANNYADARVERVKRLAGTRWSTTQLDGNPV